MGEHEHGLYAMPSLVDEETLTISPASNGPLLLEGPKDYEMPPDSEVTINGIKNTKASVDDPYGFPMDSNPSSESILLFGKICCFSGLPDWYCPLIPL